MAQTIQRIEKKYLLTNDQAKVLYEMIGCYLKPDEYYESHIYNLYLDNDHLDLIVSSSLKPMFKEKLRIRSYVPLDLDSNHEIFMEIKRKYRKVVCKRRSALPASKVKQMLEHTYLAQNQIERELVYTINHYQVKPKFFLAYDRFSYVDIQDESLRITFDYHLRGRSENLGLYDNDDNQQVLDDNHLLMEIKAHHSLPLYIINALSKLQIFPISYSKVNHLVQLPLVYQEVF